MIGNHPGKVHNCEAVVIEIATLIKRVCIFCLFALFKHFLEILGQHFAEFFLMSASVNS